MQNENKKGGRASATPSAMSGSGRLQPAEAVSHLTPSPTSKGLDRRSFLVASGSACILAVSGMSSCEETEEGGEVEQGEFPVGQVNDFTLGQVKRFDEGPFFVLRDEQGLWAMTAICTHQQCDVGVGETELPCPCHGSIFDFDGAVIRGPANRPLDNLSVNVNDDGSVIVDSSRTVPVGTRATV
ncbi:MAG: Rieske (2Fe-2S) protein [Myxococcota bacterium]|nr:Rieske (2Fe-2S) protein [Myxococcota bacterium]